MMHAPQYGRANRKHFEWLQAQLCPEWWVYCQSESCDYAAPGVGQEPSWCPVCHGYLKINILRKGRNGSSA